MRTIMISLGVLAIALTATQAYADDFTFADPNWLWVMEDYPRWHNEGDGVSYDEYGETGYLNYIQIELNLSDNTLIDPNFIEMGFCIFVDTGEGLEPFYFDFEIHPGDTYIEEQFEVGIYSYGEDYGMGELNTIPEGGGWIVIDEENSWLDRFADTGIEKVSLGKIKTVFGLH